MLKFTKVVDHSVVNMSGCGKASEFSCGIRYRMG